MAKPKKGDAPAAGETDQKQTQTAIQAGDEAKSEALEAGSTGEEAAGEPAGEAPQPEAEDHITAFERRCERLIAIAEEAEFESGTLVGDIRDALLEIFKNRQKPWTQMSAAEHGDINRALEAVAKKVIRKLVIVIAEEEEVSVHATLKGYAVDGDTFKLKVVAKGDEETAAELFRMDGHEVIMIRADHRRFHGERKPGEVLADQPTLGFSDPAPKEIVSPPPADDSDLAAEDLEPPAGSEDDAARSGVADELDAVDEEQEIAAGEADREEREAEEA